MTQKKHPLDDVSLEPQTFYAVRVKFRENNPEHGAILYTGFLNGWNGTPGGYAEIWGPYEERRDPSDALSIRIMRRLGTHDEFANGDSK